MNTMRTVGVALAIATAGGVLAACTGSEQGMPGMNHATPPASTSQPPAAAGQHNNADVAFAQGMIPHHSQAIDMSRLAAERAQSDQVKNLARQIEVAQGPEIETLNGWLRSWGVPTPQPGMPMNHGTMPSMEHENMPGMNHGNMPGMMTADDMQKLQQVNGPEFDRMFLTMMIKHHEGAVGMAQTEPAQGQFRAAKQMAQRIISSQQAEINTMHQMLNHG